MQPSLWEMIAATAVVLIVLWTIRSLNRNRAWDRLVVNGRETVRHLITILLLIGTTAGTAFTFSDGKLVLSGIWETLMSVGGIAAALECGVVFDGWYIGELDRRLLTAKGKDRETLEQQRHAAMRWFWVIIVFSFAANVIFRYRQTGSIWLAIFVSLAPIALVRLFTIVLRPLPIDYEETARQQGHRALAITTQNAGLILNRLQAKMAAGRLLSDNEKQEYAAALLTVGMWQSAKAQDALERIAGMHGVIMRQGEESGEYWTTSDLAQKYGRSLRWAQLKIRDIAGARRGLSGEQEAPRSAIVRVLGDPEAQRLLLSGRKRAKCNEITTQTNEITTQTNEITTQTNEISPQTNEIVTQEREIVTSNTPG